MRGQGDGRFAALANCCACLHGPLSSGRAGTTINDWTWVDPCRSSLKNLEGRWCKPNGIELYAFREILRPSSEDLAKYP